MAKGSFLQNSFLGGEWSALSQGQSDTREYYGAMNLCLNYLPTDEGACARRSGLRFSAHARDDSGNIRLIEFFTSDGNSYVCELTAAVMRFHALGRLKTDDAEFSVVSISEDTPAVVTTDGAHGWSTGDTVVFADLDELTGRHFHNRQYRITVLSSTTFSLAHTGPLGAGSVDGDALGLSVLAGLTVQRVTEVSIPYTAGQLAAIKHTEEEDTLFLFHPSYAPRTLDGVSLALATETFTDGPYYPQNTTATTLAFSATTGSVTVTASSIVGINDGTGFQTTDVGRLIRVDTGTATAPQWSWLRITARASTTSVTASILGDDLASGAANTKWRLGLYSDTTGWPSVGIVYEGRLYLDGPVPGRFDASRTPADTTRFFDFAPTTEDGTIADDSAFFRVFNGAGRKDIRWFQGTENALVAGTDSGEQIIRASSLDDPITPFTAQSRRATKFGAANVLPVAAGRNILFVQALGRALVEYRNQGGTWDGNDVARRGRHLTPTGLQRLAYAGVPVPIVWSLRNDNRLIGLSYRDDLDDRQAAWHRHNVSWADDNFGKTLDELGQVDDTALTGSGPVYDITVAPFSDVGATRNDTLWVAVLRGTTVCVEYLTPVFDDTFTDNEAFFVDSGNIYLAGDLGITWRLVGTTITGNTYEFYGLDRLNGKTVDATFRAADQGTAVVAGGMVTITIPRALDTASAAFETTTRTAYTEGPLTFNSNFLSTVSGGIGALGNEVASSVAQGAFLIGEDGNRYAFHEIDEGGGDGLSFFNVDTGVTGLTKTHASIFSEVQTETTGSEPGGAWNTGTGGGCGVIIPGTPYVLYFGYEGFGGVIDRYVAYYKINTSGALELVGVYATGDGGSDIQFSPNSTLGVEAFSSCGHFFSDPTTGANNAYQYKYPIAVTYHGEGRSSIIAVPSINDILANSPVVQNGASLWLAREAQFASLGMDDIMALVEGVAATSTSRAFILPVGTGVGSRAWLLFHQADIDAHAAGTASPLSPFLATWAPANTAGLISSAAFRGSSADDPTLTGLEAVSNARFLNSDGTAAFPFPDAGLKFDGTAGDPDLNYYGNPSVFASDPANPFTTPWYLFFPRIYRNAGEHDKLGIRIFRYDPKTVAFTHVDFANGQLFDFVTDGVSALFEPQVASVYWNRGTGALTVHVNGQPGGQSNTVVAEFGTFEVTAAVETIPTTDHVDAIIGCNYHSRGQLLRPDNGAGAQNGSGLGKFRRVNEIAPLFYRTGEIKFGTRFDDMIVAALPEPPVAPTDAFGRRKLFSGVSQRPLQSSYDFDNMVAWEQDRPVPGTIVSLAGQATTADR